MVHFVGGRYDVPDDLSLKCDEHLCKDQSKFSPEYVPVYRNSELGKRFWKRNWTNNTSYKLEISPRDSH